MPKSGLMEAHPQKEGNTDTIYSGGVETIKHRGHTGKVSAELETAQDLSKSIKIKQLAQDNKTRGEKTTTYLIGWDRTFSKP